MVRECQRVGLLVCSSDTTIEPDFYRHLHRSTSLHTARMYLDEISVAGEERMLDRFALPAARDLSTVRPHVVVFGCTSAGALRGREYDRQLCAKIAETTTAPVVSVMESVIEALINTGCKRILVLTPYIEELNQRIKRSLETAALEIVAVRGLGIVDDAMIAQVSVKEIIEFARNQLRGLEPDCLFFSCTNLHALDAMRRLKNAFGLPVITSNQAALDKTQSLLAVARRTKLAVGLPTPQRREMNA